MAELNVSNGDDITNAINNDPAPIIPAGSYDISGDITFWSNKEILIDGEVTLSIPGGLALSNETGSLTFAGNGHLGFTTNGGRLHIDQTAAQSVARVSLGAGAQFGDTGGHIIFEGACDLRGEQKNSGHPYVLEVSGSCTVTNTFWPDGCMDPSNWGFFWSSTSGTVTLDGCYTRGFANNCIYVSEMSGRLECYDCYFEDNTVSGVRTGADSGTYLEGCVFKHGTPSAAQWFSGGYTQRGMWLQDYDNEHNTVDLVDCDFIQDGTEAFAGHIVGNSGGTYTLNLTNTHFDNTSPAVSGGNITVNGTIGTNPVDPGNPYDNLGAIEPPEDPYEDPHFVHPDEETSGDWESTLSIQAGDAASYTIWVDGTVAHTDWGAGTLNNSATWSEDEGYARFDVDTAGIDTYLYTGTLAGIESVGTLGNIYLGDADGDRSDDVLTAPSTIGGDPTAPADDPIFAEGGPSEDWVDGALAAPPSGAVNVVDAGVDNTGSSPINNDVLALHASNTALYFPPGDYLLNPITLDGTNWTWFGDGARLLMPANTTGSWLTLHGSGWTFQNFVAPVSSGSAPVNRIEGANWTFKNFKLDGVLQDTGPGFTFMPRTNSGTTGVFENVLFPDGCIEPPGESNRAFLWAGANQGHLMMRRLLVRHAAENLIYVEAADGVVDIENSIFENNNVGVRMGGNQSFRNNRVIVDDAIPTQDRGGGVGGRVGRGVWVAGNSSYSGEVLIENCDFQLTGPDADGMVVSGNSVDHITVRNCRARCPGRGITVGPNTVTVEETHITNGGIAAAGGSVSDSCVTGSITGPTVTNTASSSCDPPILTGPLGGEDPYADPNYVHPSEETSGDWTGTMSVNPGTATSYTLWFTGDVVHSDYDGTLNDSLIFSDDEGYARVDAEVDGIDGYFYTGEVAGITAEGSLGSVWVGTPGGNHQGGDDTQLNLANYGDPTAPQPEGDYPLYPPGGPSDAWVGGSPDFTPPAGAINVANNGVDNTGSNAINNAVLNLHGSGETLYFPPGTYRLNPINIPGNNWEWVGNDATFIVPSGVSASYITFGGDNWAMRNFVFDIRGSWPNSAAPRFELSNSGDFHIENWLFDGMIGHPDLYPGGQIFNGGVAGGSTGIIENVLCPDGVAPPTNTSNRFFSWCGNNNGHLIFRRCLMVHIAQSIIYAEAASGPVTVEKCVLKDCNSGLRMGGGDTVEKTWFIMTGQVPGQRWSGGGRSARGIRWSANSSTSGSATIRDCEFDMTGPNGSTAIDAASNLTHGGFTIDNCRVRGHNISLGGNNVTATNVDVTGGSFTAGSGSLTDSCVTGTVSGVSRSNVSGSSCELPAFDYPLGEVPEPPDSGPEAPEPTDPPVAPGTGYIWDLAFVDDFLESDIDATAWSTGFGWGDDPRSGSATADPANVSLDTTRGQLVLEATCDAGAHRIGAVNTKDKVTFSPPCYLEARIRMLDLPASNNAFWAKPNSEAWPPELDMVESPTDSETDTIHHIHYSSSGSVGDSSTHTDIENGTFSADHKLSERFHTYGIYWAGDEITHFVDNTPVGTTTDPTVTGAVAAGAPFYLMLNVGVGGGVPTTERGPIPTCSAWADYDTDMEVDWVRVWERTLEDPDAPLPIGEIVNDVGENTVVFGTDRTSVLEYTMSVLGRIAPGASANVDWGAGAGHDTLAVREDGTGNRIEGALAGGSDAWAYEGALTDLTVADGITVALNGHDVTDRLDALLAYYADADAPTAIDPHPPMPDPDTAPPTDPYVFAIHGPERGRTEYEFVVEGSVTPGENANPHDDITEVDGQTTVVGRVNKGFVDDYDIDGTIVAFRYAYHRPTRVEIDGEPVALTDLPRPADEHVVSITGGGGATTYLIAADAIDAQGDIEASDLVTSLTADLDGVLTGAGEVAAGYIGGHYTDSYVIDGDLRLVAYVGAEPRVYVDGEPIDLAAYAPDAGAD